MTKEEILDSFYANKMHWKTVNRENVLRAMEQYAKQEAIGFFTWVEINYNKPIETDGLPVSHFANGEIKIWVEGKEITMEQLYDKYLQSKK